MGWGGVGVWVWVGSGKLQGSCYSYSLSIHKTADCRTNTSTAETLSVSLDCVLFGSLWIRYTGVADDLWRQPCIAGNILSTLLGLCFVSSQNPSRTGTHYPWKWLRSPLLKLSYQGYQTEQLPTVSSCGPLNERRRKGRRAVHLDKFTFCGMSFFSAHFHSMLECRLRIPCEGCMYQVVNI